MIDIEENTNKKHKDLLQTITNMIAVRNYLMSMYNTKMDRTLYKRIDSKIKMMDKDILNLALVCESPFTIVDEQDKE
jgi:hypothetical protein